MAKLRWTNNIASGEIELRRSYTKQSIWPHMLRVTKDGTWLGDAPLTNNNESSLKLNGNLNVGNYKIADWWIPTGSFIHNHSGSYPAARPNSRYWCTPYTGSIYYYKLSLRAPYDTNKSFVAYNSGGTAFSGYSFPNVTLNRGNNFTSGASITGTGIWYTSGYQQSRNGTLRYAINYSGATYFITLGGATFGYSAEA